MIEINNKKFAETEKEFIDSLFSKTGTCVGYAKRKKREILLLDHQKTPVGVVSAKGVLGSATPIENNKIWYSYGTPSIISNDSFSNFPEIFEELSIGKDHIGYIFK